MGHPGLPQDGETRHRLRAARQARGFTALLGLVYGLMVLGATVRAHGAGLACPDWPLCFGAFVPPFDFHVAFEWGHRFVAGIVSLLFAALAYDVAREPVPGRSVGRLVLAAAVLLALQVVLGGLTVLHLLASWTVTAHLVTGNAFALVLLFVVLRLRETASGSVPDSRPIPPALRALVTAGAALLAFEIVLGGLVSSHFAGLACSEWPACSDGIYFPALEGAVGLHVLHRITAYALAAVLALTAWAARDVEGLARSAALALALVAIQIGVGIVNVLLRVPVEITALHTATAIALVLTTATCARTAWRRPLRVTSTIRAQEPAEARG